MYLWSRNPSAISAGIAPQAVPSHMEGHRGPRDFWEKWASELDVAWLLVLSSWVFMFFGWHNIHFPKQPRQNGEEQEWYKEQASKPEVKEDSFNPIVVSKKTFLFPHCRNNMNG